MWTPDPVSDTPTSFLGLSKWIWRRMLLIPVGPNLMPTLPGKTNGAIPGAHAHKTLHEGSRLFPALFPATSLPNKTKWWTYCRVALLKMGSKAIT